MVSTLGSVHSLPTYLYLQWRKGTRNSQYQVHLTPLQTPKWLNFKVRYNPGRHCGLKGPSAVTGPRETAQRWPCLHPEINRYRAAFPEHVFLFFVFCSTPTYPVPNKSLAAIIWYSGDTFPPSPRKWHGIFIHLLTQILLSHMKCGLYLHTNDLLSCSLLNSTLLDTLYYTSFSYLGHIVVPLIMLKNTLRHDSMDIL